MKNTKITVTFLFMLLFSCLSTFVSLAGWEKQGDYWKYYDQDGYIQGRWFDDDGTWYHFDANARMQTGIQKIQGITYAFSSSGAMQTGWVMDNNRWYYFNSDGSGTTGWVEGQTGWYYIENGSMISNTWKTIDNQKYYFDRSGRMATNTYVGKFFLNNDGLIDENQMLTDRSYKTINDVDLDRFTTVMENIPINVRKYFFDHGGKIQYDSSETFKSTLDLMSEQLEIQATCSGNYITFHAPEDLYYAFGKYIAYTSRAYENTLFASWCDDGSLLDLLGIDSEDSAIYSTIRQNMFTVIAANIMNPDEVFPDMDNHADIEAYVRKIIYTFSTENRKE